MLSHIFLALNSSNKKIKIYKAFNKPKKYQNLYINAIQINLQGRRSC